MTVPLRAPTARGAGHAFLRGLLAFGLIYFVLLGGSGVGELLPPLKLVDGLIGGLLIALAAWRMPKATDPLDRAVLLALLLFLSACVFSQFPRQSLSAGLSAFAFTSLFYLSRRWFTEDVGRQLFVTSLRVMAVVLTPLTAVVWGSVVWTWLSTVQFAAPPPLDLPVPSFIWGHRHDVALLLVVLNAAFWTGHVARLERWLRAVLLFPLVAVLAIDGSRNLWLALALAVASVAVAERGTVTLGIVVNLFRRHPRWATVLTSAALIATLLLAEALLRRAFNVRTLDARSALWAGALEAWRLDPVTGLGPGSFPWDLQLTRYFSSAAYAPRHPDSAVFQALAEAGLVGILCLLTLATGAVRYVRHHGAERVGLWVVLVIAFASFGANPTDFAFLVVLLVLWAAYVSPPRETSEAREGPATHPGWRLRAIFATLAVPTALAFVMTSAAGFRYDDAATAMDEGRLADAQVALTSAVELDPGMALYQRDLGLMQFVAGKPDEAVSSLSAASRLNPSDTVALRGLALAYARTGQTQAAIATAQRAVDRQASSVRNLLLLASLADGDPEIESPALTRVVEIDPWLVLSETFVAEFGSKTVHAALAQALQDWLDGAPAPLPRSFQPAWLAGLTGRPDLVGRAADDYPEARLSMTALALELLGNPDGARASIARAFSSENDLVWYWRVRYALGRRAGVDDVAAHAMLTSVYPGQLADTDEEGIPLLVDSVTPGFSFDRWGYRRVPLPIAARGPTTFSASAILGAWLRDQGGSTSLIP